MQKILFLVLAALIQSNAFAASAIRTLGTENAQGARLKTPAATVATAPVVRKASLVTPSKQNQKTVAIAPKASTVSADSNRLSLVPITKTGTEPKLSTKQNAFTQGSVSNPVASSADVSALSDRIDTLEQRIVSLTNELNDAKQELENKQDTLNFESAGTGAMVRNIEMNGSTLRITRGETVIPDDDGGYVEMGFVY